MSLVSGLVVLSVLGVAVLGALPAAHAGPGPTNTATTSTTSSTHVEQETFVEVEEYQTRVTAVLDGVVVFDQTVDAPPGSPEVQALQGQAAAALSGPGCAVTGQNVTDTRQSTGSTFSDAVDHFTQEISTTTVFGPATILIGENQSQTYFVAAGSVNINTHTHTSYFVDRTTTTTFLNTREIQTVGTCRVYVPPPTTPTPTATASPASGGHLRQAGGDRGPGPRSVTHRGSRRDRRHPR